MDWKFTRDRPVYQQIMEKIQGAVLAGEFSPGEKIPSVRDFAAAAQVNPNTMQRALQELERERLLTTDGTSGRYVTADPAILAVIREKRLQELAVECAAQFAAYGLSPAQAAALLMELEKRKEP